MPISRAPFSQAQILHLMKTEFSRARRYGYPLACLLMKPDRVQLGYLGVSPSQFRESIHRELARLVAEKTRDHDHLGMVEDDGFLAVLPHTDAESAFIVADRIRQAFTGLELEGTDVELTLSLSIAACEDRDTLFFDTLLSQAEMALEWAMEAGGNRVETFRRERYAGGGPGPEAE